MSIILVISLVIILLLLAWALFGSRGTPADISEKIPEKKVTPKMMNRKEFSEGGLPTGQSKESSPKKRYRNYPAENLFPKARIHLVLYNSHSLQMKLFRIIQGSNYTKEH